tara:strand:- start:283 stop:1050 length:768 start_codon:yes stop_codon:yes gene_type:complete
MTEKNTEQSSMEILNKFIKKSKGGILEFWLMLFTVALICIKYIILPSNILSDDVDKNMLRKRNFFITIAYFLAIIMLVFYINYTNYNETCPSTDDMSGDAMYFIVMISVFPWLSIMGVCFAVLNVLPGWKSPFSNTFGYFITMFMLGGQHMINKILNIKDNDDENSAIKIVLENNFGNLINDYTPNNIEEFRKIGSDIGSAKLKTLSYSAAANDYNNIANLILLKDFIAEGIWFILMGLFVINITNSYVTEEACR